MSRQRRYGRTLPETLGEYARRKPARFHMPGHKGQDMPFGGRLAGWDITELDGTDDLAGPEGVIALTERGYAEAYGARASLLLVGGSTAGLNAMALSLGENKRVLLGRDCHKGALAALALAGHDAQFLLPAYDERDGIAGMITPRQVHEALSERQADAVLLTSPNYFGMCADVEGIANAAHSHGALLLVDGAHGAHFPFSSRLPGFPSGKVDMWCVSAHKTLAAFTQSAVLHVGPCCPIGEEQVRRMRNMVQTSSPSYLLMVSLDRALHLARTVGFEKHLDRVEILRQRIDRINGLRVLGKECLGHGIVAQDPTRLVIDVTERGIDGRQADGFLAERGIVCEMSDIYRLVLITTPQDPDEWYDRLIDGLTHLPYGTEQAIKEPARQMEGLRVCSLREAMLGPSESLPLSSAVGRIAACAAGVYPPGLATLVPGERIEGQAADYLLRQRALGFALFGVTDGRISCVREDSGL
ncbi:MAG: aminotransferase class V-fold PLP-dependent enzyme [Clostridia bacterium]|nr:aminotransferase class V-fold PLP-dependent enzyme [Candidatus Pelethousia sp.]NCB30197.1 aminotransferase class V-fold PLP-dependent enzyme [Clostridia bacterium]